MTSLRWYDRIRLEHIPGALDGTTQHPTSKEEPK